MWLIRAIDPDGNQRFIVADGRTARAISHVLAYFGLPAQLFNVEVYREHGFSSAIFPPTGERLYFDEEEVLSKGYAEAKPMSSSDRLVYNPIVQ